MAREIHLALPEFVFPFSHSLVATRSFCHATDPRRIGIVARQRAERAGGSRDNRAKPGGQYFIGESAWAVPGFAPPPNPAAVAVTVNETRPCWHPKCHYD